MAQGFFAFITCIEEDLIYGWKRIWWSSYCNDIGYWSGYSYLLILMISLVDGHSLWLQHLWFVSHLTKICWCDGQAEVDVRSVFQPLQILCCHGKDVELGRMVARPISGAAMVGSVVLREDVLYSVVVLVVSLVSQSCASIIMIPLRLSTRYHQSTSNIVARRLREASSHTPSTLS